ncbi:MAG TPA: hypothetical protein DER56_06290 [Thermosipho africanus]|nr:hypothetical protein [Thermosipho africanus]
MKHLELRNELANEVFNNHNVVSVMRTRTRLEINVEIPEINEMEMVYINLTGLMEATCSEGSFSESELLELGFTARFLELIREINAPIF